MRRRVGMRSQYVIGLLKLQPRIYSGQSNHKILDIWVFFVTCCHIKCLNIDILFLQKFKLRDEINERLMS